jgi:transposase
MRRAYPCREETEKQPGGQEGLAGHTHRLHEAPHEVIPETPEYCAHCGATDLIVLSTYAGRRQVVTVCPQARHVTEYRQQWAQCRRCGKKSVKRNFAAQRLEWGAELQALIGLLKVLHHQSDEKIQTLLRDICGVSIAQSSIGHALKRLGANLKPQAEAIRDALSRKMLLVQMKRAIKSTGREAMSGFFKVNGTVYL